NSQKVTVNDYRKLDTTTAATDVQKIGLAPVVLGDGKTVIDQSVDSGSKVLPGERLLLLTDSDKIYMPDTTTWSKADLVKLGNMLDVDVKFEGDGYCVSQSLASYEEITDQTITFKLSEKE
ncbi:PASTA domain-containing protein, partial [Klebsiella pneumoniae]